MHTLSIMTCTYDRWIKYMQCIKSSKPFLSEYVRLEIVVDKKLPKWKYKLKKYITKLILGDSNYLIYRGGYNIGSSRDIMLSNTKSDYALILDDDDRLRVTIPLLEAILGSTFDLMNFDYYPSYFNNKDIVKLDNPRYIRWDADQTKINELRMGTNTIFSVSFYRELPKEYRFRLSHVDDMIPMYVMYLKSTNIHRLNHNLIIRNRGNKSLGNTTSISKFHDLIYSLQVVFEYMKKNNSPKYIKGIISTNIIRYSRNHSGNRFSRYLKDIIDKL